LSEFMDTSTVLAVDLDGTLLRSDMLHETFWSATAQDWRNVFRSFWFLLKGRLEPKCFLSEQASIDVTTLPYDTVVLDLISEHRAAGGRTVLVSASHQDLVQRIAEHLGLFDEAHGSSTGTNLKGHEKRKLLEQRYGLKRFIYVGDSASDLAVWASAKQIVTVDASSSVRARVEQLGPPFTHLNRQSKLPMPYLRVLRPHQWLKNVLIFIPILASHQFTPDTSVACALSFLIFCMVSSGVYVMNDLMDLSADRAHPRKRHRAFASGAIPPAHGLILLITLQLSGIVLSLLIGWQFTLVLLLYFIITSMYSMKLKRKVGVDICILASLYTMRIIAGGVATGISISSWLLAFSLFFFFSMAALKRQGELVDLSQRNELEIKGRGWVVKDLPVLSSAVLASGYLSVLIMALYVNSDQVRLLYSEPAALWGICVVLFYWITRMELLTNRGNMHDDPIVFAIKDRVSHYCLVGMLTLAIFGALL